MRRFLVPLVLVAAFLGLVVLPGCCGGPPTFTIRSPLQIDSEPATVAGPRLMAAPTYYAPQYAPTAAPQLPAGYAAPAAAAPCN